MGLGDRAEAGEQKEKAPDAAVWRYRPLASAAAESAVLALPLALAVGVAVLIELVFPEPANSGARVGWWIGLLGLSIVVLIVSARITRRARALPVLLKMGLVFPDRAPNRLAVAWRAASAPDCVWCLDQTHSKEGADAPTISAERVVELAACLGALDHKSRSHTERVRALTDLVAVELHLPDPDRDRLRWAVVLHETEKLTVRSDLLNRHRSPSSSEQDLVRRPPLEGATLTEAFSEWIGHWTSTAVQPTTLDSSGYPFGLEGDAISLGARTLAVLDAYDVMTRVHSYKGPLSPDAARAQLARLAGSQLDPVVVRAFLAIPVKRLPRLHLSGVGSNSFDKAGSQLAVLGRGATALVVVGAIVGLTSWKPWVADQGRVDALASHGGAGANGQGGIADYPPSGASTQGSANGTVASRTGAGSELNSKHGSKGNPKDRRGSGDRGNGRVSTSSGGDGPGGLPGLLLTGFPGLFDDSYPTTTTTTSGGRGSTSTTSTTASTPPPTTTPTTSPTPPTTTPTPPTTTPTTSPTPPTTIPTTTTPTTAP
jgi:hypothetical protein